jgi:hypothetical protein
MKPRYLVHAGRAEPCKVQLMLPSREKNICMCNVQVTKFATYCYPTFDHRIRIIIVTDLESHTRCASRAHVVRLYVP